MSDITTYNPTQRFDNTNLTYDNHWKLTLEALPDVAFFAQRVNIPLLAAEPPKQFTPFTDIPQVGDKLTFGALDITFAIDATFKTYFSLFYWMKGYGFPDSYDDILNFHATRKIQLGNPRALPRQMDMTTAVLSVLRNDTDSLAAEIRFTDVFPTHLMPVSFSTTEGSPNLLTCQASFRYTDYDVVLIAP